MSAFPVSVPQRRLLAVVVLCVAAAIVYVRSHHSTARAGPALRVAPIRPTAGASDVAAARKRIVVDVVGAVARPGLYHLPPGARVADAVTRAGGLTRKAERTAVNLAAPLADGEQLLVAAHGASLPAASGGSGAASSAPISLSTATAEQLDTLPGVGPVTAQKIVTYRQQNGPFTSVEALDAIPGIGPARIADLKGLVVP